MTTTKKDWEDELWISATRWAENKLTNGEFIAFIRNLLDTQKKDLISWCEKEKHLTYPSKEVEYWKEKSRCLDWYNDALSKVIEKLKEV